MKKIVFFFIVLITPLLFYLFFRTNSHPSLQLPIYFPEEVRKIIVDGKEKTDTVYHTIPPFRFVNQLGDTVTEKYFQDKTYVANFFFSTCPSVCPKMMSQMERVNTLIQDIPETFIISHSVNPAHDSVPVLAEYAKSIHADSKNWMLVTGKKKEIYDIAIDGYKLGVDEDVRSPGGFLHSEMFVLVDKDKRIRGYYNGTDSTQVDKLIQDIKMLRTEYEPNNTPSDLIQTHQ